MAKYTSGKKVLASNEYAYVGIDVHRKSWFVTILVEGCVVFKGNIESFYSHLRGLFDRLPDCVISVAYEAGPCGFDLWDRLENDNIRCTVVPPSLIETSPGRRVKVDRLDSLKLAEDLAAGRLPSVFVLSPKQRADRDLVRTRQQILKHTQSTKLQIKSKLLFHGIRVPGVHKWSKRHIAALRSLNYPSPSIQIAFLALLDLLEHLTRQRSQLEKAVNELAETDDYKHLVDLLVTVPGIGVLTAMIIATELGDFSRFEDNEHLAAFLGLTPSEWSSGETVHRGHITHCGNARVRKALVESSWTLIRFDARLRRKYKRLSGRIGPKRAIVAIARILSGRIRHIVLHNEAYLCAA